MIRNRKRESGQGMTEYIIMVALIAVAAIGIYGLFGQTLRTQVADLADGLAGNEGGNNAGAVADQGDAEASRDIGLGNYNE
ncbi:MAG: pilus assembly protein [Myxococcota bacterium]